MKKLNGQINLADLITGEDILEKRLNSALEGIQEIQKASEELNGTEAKVKVKVTEVEAAKKEVKKVIADIQQEVNRNPVTAKMELETSKIEDSSKKIKDKFDKKLKINLEDYISLDKNSLEDELKTIFNSKSFKKIIDKSFIGDINSKAVQKFIALYSTYDKKYGAKNLGQGFFSIKDTFNQLTDESEYKLRQEIDKITIQEKHAFEFYNKIINSVNELNDTVVKKHQDQSKTIEDTTKKIIEQQKAVEELQQAEEKADKSKKKRKNLIGSATDSEEQVSKVVAKAKIKKPIIKQDQTPVSLEDENTQSVVEGHKKIQEELKETRKEAEKTATAIEQTLLSDAEYELANKNRFERVKDIKNKAYHKFKPEDFAEKSEGYQIRTTSASGDSWVAETFKTIEEAKTALKNYPADLGESYSIEKIDVARMSLEQYNEAAEKARIANERLSASERELANTRRETVTQPDQSSVLSDDDKTKQSNDMDYLLDKDILEETFDGTVQAVKNLNTRLSKERASLEKTLLGIKEDFEELRNSDIDEELKEALTSDDYDSKDELYADFADQYYQRAQEWFYDRSSSMQDDKADGLYEDARDYDQYLASMADSYEKCLQMINMIEDADLKAEKLNEYSKLYAEDVNGDEKDRTKSLSLGRDALQTIVEDYERESGKLNEQINNIVADVDRLNKLEVQKSWFETPHQTEILSDNDVETLIIPIDELLEDELLLESLIDDLEEEVAATDKVIQADKEHIEVKKELNNLLQDMGLPIEDEEISKENTLLREQSQEVIEIEQALNSLTEQYKKLTYMVEAARNNWDGMSNSTKEALQQLKLFDKNGKFLGDFNKQGMVAQGAVMNGSHAIIARQSNTYDRNDPSYYNYGTDNYLDLLIKKEQEAYEQGINLARILSVIEGYDGIYEIQEQAIGSQVHDISRYTTLESYLEKCRIVTEATDEQLQKLLKDAIALNNLGFKLDFGVGNILYDKDNGFTFIDLELRELDEKIPETQDLIRQLFKSLAGGELVEKYTNSRLSDFISEDNLQRLNAMVSVAQRLQSVFDVSNVPYLNAITNAQKTVSEKVNQTPLPSPLFEDESGQLSFVEQIKKSVGLIEEESGQMAMFENVAEKAIDSVIEGQMTLNDILNKNIEGQMTLNDLINQQTTSESTVKFVENEKEKQKTKEQTSRKIIASEEKISAVLSETLRHAQDLKNTFDTMDYSTTDQGAWDIFSYKTGTSSKKNEKSREHLYELLGLGINRNGYKKQFTEMDILRKFGTVENAARELHQALVIERNIHRFINNYSLSASNRITPSMERIKTESSGQIAFDLAGVKDAEFTIVESQEEIRTELEKTNEDIQGQINMFDYLTGEAVTNFVKLRRNARNGSLGKSDNTIIPELEQINKVAQAEHELAEIVEETEKKSSAADKKRAKNAKATADNIAEAKNKEKKAKQEFPVVDNKEVGIADKVADASKKAADAKLEVKTANEQVQDSVDGSKSKLELETELMERLALAARMAADAKLEFVNANKKTADSVDETAKRSKNSSDKTPQEAIEKTKKLFEKLNPLYEINYKNAYVHLGEELNNFNESLTRNELTVKEYISSVEKAFNDFKIKNPLLKGNLIEGIFGSPDDARKFAIENAKTLGKITKDFQYVTNNKTGITTFTGEVRNAIGEVNRLEYEYNSTTNKMSVSTKYLRTEAVGLARVIELIGEKAKKLGVYWFANAFNPLDLLRYGKTWFDYVNNYDASLTSMMKVSQESKRVLQEFQKESYKLADSVGTTASQLQNSTADFLRLGESLEQAKQSAQDANILLNISEFSNIEDATTALTAMSQAYNELEKGEINDVLNEVGNNYSISTSQLAQALQDSAAVLKTQGNDLNEAVALITAGNAITQDATKTAGGVRTISLRIAGTEEAKNELESLGESVDDYVVQTKSKTDEIIRNYTAVASNMGKGISVLDANGNLRNTYDIMLDISKIYKEIQEEDKKYGTNRAQALVEYIAGKNRSNIASSILLNPELLENVKDSAENANGSAQRELERQLESIAGHLAKLKNQWEDIWGDTANRELINFFLDFATAILKLVDEFGILNTVVTAGSGLLLITKNIGLLETTEDKLIGINSNLKDLINSFKNVNKETRKLNLVDINFAKDKIRQFNMFDNPQDVEDFMPSVGKNSLEDYFIDLQKKGELKSASWENYCKYVDKTNLSLKNATLSTKLLTVGMKALNTALNMAATAAVLFVVNLGIQAIDNYIHRVENATTALEEYNSTIKQQKETYQSHKELVDDTVHAYERLSKGVDLDTNQNISLSEENYEEFLNTTNELAEAFPTLVKGYDDNGNAILDFGSDCETTKEKLEELLETEREYNSLKISNELPEYFKNLSTVLDDYEKQLKNLNRNSSLLSEQKDFLDNLVDNGLQIDGNKASVSFGELGEESQHEIGAFLSNSVQDFVNSLKQSEKDILGITNFSDIYRYDNNTETAWLDLTGLNSDQLNLLKQVLHENALDLQASVGKEFANTGTEISQVTRDQNVKWSSFTNMLVDSLDASYAYDQLDGDETSQNLVKQLVSGLDVAFLKEIEDSGIDPTDWVDSSIIVPLSQLDAKSRQKVAEAYSDLLELNPQDLSNKNQEAIRELLKILSETFGLDENQLRISLGFDIDEDYQKQYNNAVKASVNRFGGEDSSIQNIFSELEIDSEEEVNRWLKIIKTVDNATEAKKKYLETPINGETLSSTDRLTQIQTLSKGLGQLDSIMADIIDGKEFDFSSILNNEDFKNSFGKYKEEYENFIETISKSPKDVSKCQKAFDDLATAYVYGSGVLQNLNEETKEASILQLEQNGVKNAAEVVSLILEKYSEGLKIAETYSFNLENANYQQIASFIELNGIVGESAEALFNYALTKELCSSDGINTAQDCNNLIALAESAGVAGEALSILVKIRNLMNVTKENGWGEQTVEMAKAEIDNLMTQLRTADFNIDFGGGAKSKEAGEKAGDAYVEAFEKELESLQILRDRGEITEKEYLDRLKILYEKYFKDRKEYLDEFKKYETEYLKGMESLYNAALSGITKLIDKRIDKLNDEKDAVLDALEEEKEARIEAIESQIEAKQEIIDGIQDEIDKMQEANEERKRQIDLQKKQYNLARLEAQKTQLIYKDGQMIYEADYSGIRDAREEVADAKLEIEISNKEKQISLLEEEIELLEKQKESVEDYYDKMIEQQEKYFDSLIKNLETQKSKWEELADIKEVAEAYSAIEQVFGDLGYTVEDVLNGSEGAFEDFKSKYISILSEMNSNTSFGEGLSYAVGELDKSLAALGKDTEGLDTLTSKMGEVEDSVVSVANAISGTSASTGTSGGKGEESGSTGGTTSSLKKAIEEQTTDSLEKIKQQTDAFAGEEGSLEAAVQDVITKVAGGGSSGEGSSSDNKENSSKSNSQKAGAKGSEDTSNLMGAIQAQTAAALDEEAGIPAQKKAWEELNTPLGKAKDYVLDIKTALEDMDGKTFTVTLNVNGGGGFHSFTGSYNTELNGTANLDGTANLQGDWGLEKDGRSLVGELGREIVVRGNRFFTVGNTGAEFVDLKRGDIVFNHRQTEELLKNGKINTRGKAFVQGNYMPLEFINPDKFNMLQKIDGINKGIDQFIKNLSKFNTAFDSTVKNISNIKNINHSQDVNISIGDINLTGVQDVNGLANAISTKLPNVLLQTMTKRK